MMSNDVAYSQLVTFLAEPTADPMVGDAEPGLGTSNDADHEASPAGARVSVTSIDHADRRTVTVVGRIVIRHVGEIRSRLAELLDVDRREVVVDLTNLVELDAAGLIALTTPLMASRRRGARVALVEPRSPEANRMLTLTGIVPSLTRRR